MDLYPVINKPAIIIESEKRYLVIADLHLGKEYEYYKKGIKVPDIGQKMKSDILKIIKRKDIEELILLGDIKHNLPFTSYFEKLNLPKFLEFDIPVKLIKGNHDGNIEEIVNNETMKSFRIEDHVLTHGHILIEGTNLIMGHVHPVVEFMDSNGKITRLKCFLRMEGQQNVIVLPSFNPVIEGIPINRDEEIPGPYFESGRLEIKEFDCYLLDGTYMGKVKDIYR
ncbi:MAG: Calcineurin-like phosphoesterase superfamily domain protein [Candidatus Methanofastidiosum methylothiophilum]|uniref:Calcineurin-like phosphoesterase superfamily domain protein n=1 Tax=Candidatus Methanofastidiosum methylothiophilum TaxID=1705564 RepID=A0A150J1G4_9EURY|nr:MAG: Calcineurin-like phosphoesterase superfamily domain protein [Candidatus Methanofastidiosum methylthiophilus]KYC48429.1 MAG: Calcineurin-like phosphoesterase superfamily domain protein [Candidatus Methanofastidiosum methylthiophilus]KYC51059.1 MAG: Calcineurin-like phosphoesterase superfamily domain protein [Candidatus Methanofastidiosum methylthiophilus]